MSSYLDKPIRTEAQAITEKLLGDGFTMLAKLQAGNVDRTKYECSDIAAQHAWNCGSATLRTLPTIVKVQVIMKLARILERGLD